MAGGVEQSAVNFSGSAPAIAAGSIEPKRSRILAGPAKARSMGNCWSRSMPTRSANGSSESTLSAAGSWAIVSAAMGSA